MTKRWADHPFKILSTPTTPRTDGVNTPLHPSLQSSFGLTDCPQLSKHTIKVATEMTLAHNIFFRNFNAIYLQAPHITAPSDIRAFLTFIIMVLEALHHHHSIEERVLFPAIAEYSGVEGIMETNVAQHHEFEAGVEELKKYAEETTPETYDGVEVRRIVDGFGGVLERHLGEEIESLLSLDEYGGEKLKGAWEEVDRRVFKEIEDVHRVLPVAMGANDLTFEGGANKNWPPLPWFVQYIAKYYIARRYKESWRFSPCTLFGVPRDLEFVVDE